MYFDKEKRLYLPGRGTNERIERPRQLGGVAAMASMRRLPVTGLRANLVSYWMMDEEAGVFRPDWWGPNHLWPDQSPSRVTTGKIGYTSAFNGTFGQRLYLPDANQVGLGFTGSFSFSLWYRIASQPEAGHDTGILSKTNLAGTRSYWMWYGSNGGTSRIGFIRSVDGTGGTQAQVNYNVTLTVDTWYHLAFTFNSAGQRMDIYVNGSSVANVTSAGASQANTNADFAVGHGGAGSRGLNGWIDELGAWSTNLSAANITTLYNSGNGARPI